MSDYLLSIKIPLKAVDDSDARKRAGEQLLRMGINPAHTKRAIKLQRLDKGSQPTKVTLRGDSYHTPIRAW